MIIALLIGIMSVFVSSWIGLRPAWNPTLPATTIEGVQYMFGLDPILPVSEVFFCCGSLILAFGAMTAFKWYIKLADWVSNIIP